MVKPIERVSDPLSDAELERRWAAVREVIRDNGVDAILVQGANNITGVGGYYRWIVGTPVFGSYAETALFPKDGLMTVVGHGTFGAVAEMGGKDPTRRGVGRRLSTPTFPAVRYCDGYDAELVAGEIEKAGYRKIGLVGPNTIYYGFASRLMKLVPNVEFIDVTEPVDVLRANKSPEEIDLIRRCASMQDDIFDSVPEQLKAGMRDYQVFAHGNLVGQLQGSYTGYFLGNSAPAGEPTFMSLRNDQDREIRDGDVLLYQAENTGPGGYFTHACRYYVLGKAPQELVDRWNEMVEAQDYTAELLISGMSSADIFKDYNNYMEKRGFPIEERLHAHSQGYDVVERPMIRNDETMNIGPNMNIGIHPRYWNERVFVTVCDNFLVHEGRVELLSRTPRKIFEL